MSQTVTVEVTAKDILFGRPCSPCGCPVALALRRCLQMVAKVDDCITLYDDQDPAPTITLPLPDEVDRFIGKFDNHQAVEPFSFEVEVP
jgi:hypothetical protein